MEITVNSLVEKIEKWRKNGGRISSLYDMGHKEILAFTDAKLHRCELVMEVFRYGYMQGAKATQAEMKKAVAK